MINLMIIIAALALLAGLLYCEKRDLFYGRLFTKSLLSSLFVVTVLVQPHSSPLYFYFLLFGLLFCLIGDVSLAFPGDKPFIIGLGSFLCAHIFYVLAFFYLAEASNLVTPFPVLLLLVSSSVFIVLNPHLGELRLPVVVYIIIVTLMAWMASAVLLTSGVAPAGRIFIFLGAVLFYFSDIFVAREKFLSQDFLNQQIGLPLYFVAQFLLAFSPRLVGGLLP